MFTIIPIPAFNDNYIWCIIHQPSNDCIIIDPGDATPVLKTVTKLKLNLIAILITHHHFDHTGGIARLTQDHRLKIYGPTSEKIKAITEPVNDGDVVSPGVNWPAFRVIATPGHTLDHICYFANQWLFCGDTLFTAGCGRLFEGNPAQMLNSLCTLSQLPINTEVYCAHEYTMKNLLFAKSLEPNNQQLLERFTLTQALRKANKPTVPATLEVELATNPFLRCHLPQLQQAIAAKTGHQKLNTLETFTYIRQLKDKY